VTPPFAIQRAQAAEAVQSATRPTLPIVFVGDFNSVADEPRHIDRGRYVSPYRRIISPRGSLRS